MLEVVYVRAFDCAPTQDKTNYTVSGDAVEYIFVLFPISSTSLNIRIDHNCFLSFGYAHLGAGVAQFLAKITLLCEACCLG